MKVEIFILEPSFRDAYTLPPNKMPSEKKRVSARRDTDARRECSVVMALVMATVISRYDCNVE